MWQENPEHAKTWLHIFGSVKPCLVSAHEASLEAKYCVNSRE